MYFNMSGINIKKIRTKSEYHSSLQLRCRSRPFRGKEITAYSDPLDFQDGTTILLAEDNGSIPLGTMRLIDRGLSSIELEKYHTIDSVIPKSIGRLVEVTRWCVPLHIESTTINLALYKALFRYCKAHKIDLILLSSEKPLPQELKHLVFGQTPVSKLYEESIFYPFNKYSYFIKIKYAEKYYQDYDDLLHKFIVHMTHHNISFR